MNTTIYLIRHGETEWNQSGRFQGCIDTSLTETGIRQAKHVAAALDGQFDFIYSSPLERAMVTARIIGEKSRLPAISHAGLIEIDFGAWEGLTPEEMARDYPREFQSWKTDKLTGTLCGGDGSIKACSLRGKNTILQLASLHAGGRIATVAHGGIIKAMLIGLLDWDMTMYHKVVIGNTSITTIELTETLEHRLITLNDTHHIK